MSYGKKLTGAIAVGAGVLGGIALAAPAHAATSDTYLYIESNATAGNSVLAFHADGTPIGSYATSGTGTGAGLGDQGALATGDFGHRLFAVNAGSNSLSAFSIARDGSLRLLDTEPTGPTPVSVATSGNRVYVLGSSNVTTFYLFGGRLVEAGQTPLSAGAAGPAQVSVTPDGRDLMVTEKGSNTIDVLRLGFSGVPGAAHSAKATGATPFGFGFGSNGVAVVADAAGGPNGTSEVSAYRVGRHGAVSTSPAIPDNQNAACWSIVSPDGSVAYIENAASGSISTVGVGDDGSLTLLNQAAATPGGHVADPAVANGQLWVLDNKNGRIDDIPASDAQLGTPTSPVTAGVPASAEGLVAVPAS